jgi:hypothetical protein
MLLRTSLRPSSELILVRAGLIRNPYIDRFSFALFLQYNQEQFLARSASAILEWFSTVVISTFKYDSASPTLMIAGGINLQVHLIFKQ